MTAGLKPYAATKSSGVKWLGSVPRHWDVQKLRRVLRRYTERNRPDLPLLSVVREKGVILRDTTSTDENHNYVPDDLSNYKVVRSGQFAVNKMKAWQGSYGVSRHDGIVSPAYFIFDVSGLEADFFNPAIRSRAYVPAFTRASDGVRIGQWDLVEPRMREIEFLVPPRSEQVSIVRFLNHADRRIRRYIHAKQKLIALLEEQKQVIIHQAATGQIDVRTGQPYPAYKPSGVEGLGDVPKHWEMLRLGRLITLTVGFPFKSDGFTQSDDDMRLLRGVNIAPGRIRWDDVVRWPATDLHMFADYGLEVGDIVLGMDRPIVGDGIRIAVAAQADVPSLLLQRVARIRPGRELMRDFALRLLGGNSLRDYLAPIFTGISVPHLSPEQIKGFWLALPSVAEQEAIVENLRSRVGAFQCAMHGALEEIALLREYRTRLIADVVTGKLDVREAAAGLPDDDPFARDHALDGGEEADDLSTSGGEVGATESEEVDNLVRDGRDAPGRQQVPA